jgi:hypothetical protein
VHLWAKWDNRDVEMWDFLPVCHWPIINKKKTREYLLIKYFLPFWRKRGQARKIPEYIFAIFSNSSFNSSGAFSR